MKAVLGMINVFTHGSGMVWLHFWNVVLIWMTRDRWTDRSWEREVTALLVLKVEQEDKD
jgi:hypothetical protein